MLTHLLPILQYSSSSVENVPQVPAGALAGLALVWLAVMVFLIACGWKLFTKAGEPGWASIVPIYNAIVLLKIAGKPWWWLILLCIPFVGFIMAILVAISLAKSFGQSTGFGIGIALLGIIFVPILAFGSARYIGPQP